MVKDSKENILRTLRLNRKVPQAVVAEAIGVSRSHLANIERGNDLPGREVLVALADYYEVSLDWLSQRAGSVNAEGARAETKDEAILLSAYRALPPNEAAALLNMMLARMAGKN
ncbi:MAG TPA: helix-turn-helix transcriptional regulator [Acidocella sp.]|nr:helix-turn-helix transcriptional regulator [Acidocella sp.]